MQFLSLRTVLYVCGISWLSRSNGEMAKKKDFRIMAQLNDLKKLETSHQLKIG